MEFVHRHKAGLLLISFIFFSLICLTNQVDPYVRGIKTCIWFFTYPEVVYSGEFFNKLDSLQGRLFKLTRAEGENHILREQNVQLAKQGLERDALQLENNRLRNLLKLKTREFSDSIAGEVVSHDVREWFYSVIINKGKQDGVELSAAVVAPSRDGLALVGRVVDADQSTCRVLLITDPISAVSVSVAASGDLGLLEGRNRPMVLVRYLPSRAKVKAGDEIQTVGLGGVFPSGVRVGRVKKVAQTLDGFFKEALVEPYLDFGSIREVLILKRNVDLPEEPTS